MLAKKRYKAKKASLCIFYVMQWWVTGVLGRDHLPAVTRFCCSITLVVIVVGHRESPRHMDRRIIFDSEVRIGIYELAALNLAGYSFINLFLPARLIALP